MKIGFSFGQCIRDIVQGKVKTEDVIVIVAGTRIETLEQLEVIVRDYMYRADYLLGLDEKECYSVASHLWDTGKIHQPRIHGTHRRSVPADCVWADVLPSPATSNASLQEAWDHYRLLVDLTVGTPEKAVEAWHIAK